MPLDCTPLASPLASAARPPAPERLADHETPLLYEHWYLAGFSQEFGRRLIERTFLNQSVVLYESDSGEIIALRNRCAHRSFPLAKSWLEEGGIRCRYHGAKYNDTGRMVDLPSQSSCPRVHVRRYPVRRVGPLVWIWIGDPERADAAKIPDTSWLDAGQGWEVATGGTRVNGSYVLMMENLMDLTHIPFLHRESFRFPRSYAEANVHVEVEGEALRYFRRDVEGYHRMAFFPPSIAAKLDGRVYSSISGGEFVSPAMMFGRGEIHPADGGTDGQSSYLYRVPHFLTPETQYTSHYWYCHTRNFCQDDKAYTAKLAATLSDGFAEDKFAIESVQQLLLTDGQPFREVHYRTDKPTVVMRRILRRLADAEALGQAQGRDRESTEA